MTGTLWQFKRYPPTGKTSGGTKRRRRLALRLRRAPQCHLRALGRALRVGACGGRPSLAPRRRRIDLIWRGVVRRRSGTGDTILCFCFCRVGAVPPCAVPGGVSVAGSLVAEPPAPSPGGIAPLWATLWVLSKIMRFHNSGSGRQTGESGTAYAVPLPRSVFFFHE